MRTTKGTQGTKITKVTKVTKAPTITNKAKAATRKPAGLRILMIASEAQPFSKTGGLADVATALPKALGRLGHDVTVVTPRYRGIEAGAVRRAVAVGVAGATFTAEFYEAPLGPGARALLLDCPPLYDRAGIYNERWHRLSGQPRAVSRFSPPRPSSGPPRRPSPST